MFYSENEKHVEECFLAIEKRAVFATHPPPMLDNLSTVIAETIRATIQELALTPVPGAEFRKVQDKAVNNNSFQP